MVKVDAEGQRSIEIPREVQASRALQVNQQSRLVEEVDRPEVQVQVHALGEADWQAKVETQEVVFARAGQQVSQRKGNQVAGVGDAAGGEIGRLFGCIGEVGETEGLENLLSQSLESAGRVLLDVLDGLGEFASHVEQVVDARAQERNVIAQERQRVEILQELGDVLQRGDDVVEIDGFEVREVADTCPGDRNTRSEQFDVNRFCQGNASACCVDALERAEVADIEIDLGSGRHGEEVPETVRVYADLEAEIVRGGQGGQAHEIHEILKGAQRAEKIAQLKPRAEEWHRRFGGKERLVRIGLEFDAHEPEIGLGADHVDGLQGQLGVQNRALDEDPVQEVHGGNSSALELSVGTALIGGVILTDVELTRIAAQNAELQCCRRTVHADNAEFLDIVGWIKGIEGLVLEHQSGAIGADRYPELPARFHDADQISDGFGVVELLPVCEALEWQGGAVERDSLEASVGIVNNEVPMSCV